MEGSRHIAGEMLPLRLDGVTFVARGRTIIESVSVEIAPRARTVILGPNGAGKSVLLRLCHGLLRPTDGAIRWSANLPARELARRQAMVFQRPVMLRRSAMANVTYALYLHGVANPARRERAARALDRTGLGRLADQPARLMSGGEQQRLAFARAWALEPEVMFLDEPTANLDPQATLQIERIIEAIATTGTTIVLTTHDLGQARRLADHVVFLHQGRILEHTPADIFFETPRTNEARAFVRGELLA